MAGLKARTFRMIESIISSAENSAPRAARALADRFAGLPETVAVALAGSRTAGEFDDRSDIDLYVYAHREIPLEVRRAVAGERAIPAHVEIGNRFWEPGDEWIDASTGTPVDIMYRTPSWIEEQIDRILIRHEASMGYSTCLWWNVLTSAPLYDRGGWLARLQARADQAYPEPLQKAIVGRNHPVLRENQSSYLAQIVRAARRSDPVAVNHRVTALLASYFDILFALNRIPHPGEKHLLVFAGRLCERLPGGFEAQVRGLLGAVAPPLNAERLASAADALIDGLDAILKQEGLIGI